MFRTEIIAYRIDGKITNLRMLTNMYFPYTSIKYEFRGEYYLVSPKIDVIGPECFRSTKIKRISLPKKLKIIEYNAFRDSKLEEIRVPNQTEMIGRDAFSKCTNLKNVYLPDNLTEIEDDCFLGCTSLEYIKLPKNLETIAMSLFEGCKNLKTVIMPEKLKEIKEGSFIDCHSLKELTIKSNVKIECCSFSFLERLIVEFKDIEDIISFIEKNAKNILLRYTYYPDKKIELIFKGRKLTNEEQARIKELLKDQNYTVKFECDKELEEKIITFKDKEIQTILDEINLLCSKLNTESKNIILNKVNKLIEEYHRDIIKLKPKYGEELKFGETEKDIRSLKPELIDNLNSIKNNLTKEKELLKLLEDLSRYKQYIKTNIKELTKEDNTIDTMIKNIVYYCNFIPEDKKKSYLDRLNQYIDDRLIKTTKAFNNTNNNKIELNNISKTNEELEFRTNIDNLYSEIANYAGRVKPFKLLQDKLISKEKKEEFIDSDDLLSLFDNIDYVINKLSNSNYKEELNKSFTESKEKYLELVNGVINDKNKLKSINYKDIEKEIRKDIHNLLKSLDQYARLDKYEKELFISSDIITQIRESIEIVNKEKELNVEDYKDQAITSDVIEIVNIIKDRELIDNENKERIKEDLLKKLEEHLNTVSNNKITSLEEYKKEIIETLKDIVEVKMKMRSYLKKNKIYVKVAEIEFDTINKRSI